MADAHSIQCERPHVAALEKAAIFVKSQREQNERIIALLCGAIALLDPDKEACALTLLEIASDDAGDIGNLIAFENALQEMASL